MSQNKAVIENMYAAYGRGDLAAILGLVADDAVWSWEAPSAIRAGGTRRGKQEITGFFEGLMADFDNPSLNVSTFVCEGDSVATFGQYEATARATGRRFSSPVAHYFRLKDGKVVEYRNFINSAAIVAAMTGAAGA